ncbi:F28 protein [Hirschfeldia incana]|nr:F28 protein [Hirschfeldia incana]
MRSLVSFTLMIFVLVLAMLIMVADSSYGEGGKKRSPPPMAPSPSPSSDGGHFGGTNKTLPSPPNSATFTVFPQLISATVATTVSFLVFIF